jgi:hypothetical protein
MSEDEDWQQISEEATRLRPPWLVRRWWIWVACLVEVIDGLVGVVTLGFLRPPLQSWLISWRWRAYGYACPPPAEKG